MMTIDEMRNKLDKYCKGFDLCSDGCRLRKPDDGSCRWNELSDESTEDCYHFLVGLIGKPEQLKKFKNWLIDKLGGYTKEDMNILYESQVVVRRLMLQAWVKTVQEICRRSENSYYDWCCEYCAVACDKRNGWCEKFMPRIGDNDERRSAEES